MSSNKINKAEKHQLGLVQSLACLRLGFPPSLLKHYTVFYQPSLWFQSIFFFLKSDFKSQALADGNQQALVEVYSCRSFQACIIFVKRKENPIIPKSSRCGSSALVLDLQKWFLTIERKTYGTSEQHLVTLFIIVRRKKKSLVS